MASIWQKRVERGQPAEPSARLYKGRTGDALATKEFWRITGEAGDGTLMAFPPDPRRNPAY